ncbi:retrovirus-related pol polyprotein from transposon TNT 1-94 [Tanacetum coccineum]|uniref:Retrovirus-related pol polyprotein from transposon TNT 1-94 n=1 Tax=Tanacetum coccineum TaxID=301880 RepID=A0ABQ4XPT1_9ASTR
MSNALADLGASIIIMPYLLFKRLGLGSLKLIKMTIEMADRSMMSPKGIKENVLVKISNFVFPVDFVILDIMEDENVPIILGRPVLATAHAKIDVYGKKISLGVGNEQVRDFENYLSPKYESQDIILLLPSELAKDKEEFSMTLGDPDKRMSIGLEEFVDIDVMWDDLDPWILSNEKATNKFLKSGDRIHLHSLDNLQLSCKTGSLNMVDTANPKVLDYGYLGNSLEYGPRLDFAKVLDDETTLTFLLDLGYKGPLHKHPSMYVDHMHQPWRTLAAIINKCLSGKAASNDRLRESKIDIIWGMFYRENVDYLELIWEDFAFQIDYRQLKKGRSENMPYPSRGKGSQWKKTTDTSEADVEVSEESDSEPMRKQTSSRRVIKKKVIISTDDNIIPEPNIALEIMTKSVPEPARRRPSGIDFRDTSSVSKKKSHDLSQKLKGVQTLTPKEQLVADTMKALKESKKQQKTASERTGTKPGVLDEENVTSESPIINLEKIDDEETDDEFVHSEENVQDDDEDTDDEETDDELVHANEQVDVEKTKVVKDEIKKAKLPPKISSLFVSPGFDPLHVVIQRVYVLKKDVQELKEVDNTITLRTSLISEIPSAINAYLGSSLGDALQKEDPKKVLRKIDHDNEDPLTGPNQGKKTKKSRAKESESSKKSSTSKETSTGKLMRSS